MEHYLNSTLPDLGLGVFFSFLRDIREIIPKEILKKPVVIQHTSFDQCQELSSSFDILSITDLHKIFLMESLQPPKKN